MRQPWLTAKRVADIRSHHAMTLALGGKLYLAPLKKDIKVLLSLPAEPQWVANHRY